MANDYFDIGSDINYLRLPNTLGGGSKPKNVFQGVFDEPYKKKKKNPFALDFGAEDQPEYFNEKIGAPQVEEVGSSGDDIFEIMKKHFTPETQDTERLRQLLESAPKMEEPGLMRRLMAGAAYLGNKERGIAGGQDAAEKVRYAPYLRDMTEWTAKSKPFYDAANLERQANATQQQLMGNAATVRRAEITAEETRKRTEAQERTKAAENASKERIAKARNEVTMMINSGYTFTVVGNKLFAHSKDGSSYEAGEASDYSPRELEILKQAGREKIESMRGDTQRDVAATRAGATTRAAEIRGGRTSASGGESGIDLNDPKNYTARRAMALQQAYDTEEFHEFVEPPATPNGMYQIKPPESRFLRGVDPEKAARYKKFRIAIGLDKPEAPPAATPAGTAQAPAPAATPQAESKGAFQPRGEYTSQEPFVGPLDPRENTPAFVEGARKVGGVIKSATTPPKAGGNATYNKQYMTPEGIKTVPQGKTALKDLETNTIIQLPDEKVDAAIATKRYVRVD